MRILRTGEELLHALFELVLPLEAMGSMTERSALAE